MDSSPKTLARSASGASSVNGVDFSARAGGAGTAAQRAHTVAAG